MTENSDSRFCVDRKKLKREIRQTILQKRDALPDDLRRLYSRQIAEKVLAAEQYRNAENILIYVSFRSEVETLPLIHKALQDGKKVYLPRVMPSAYEDKTGEMAFFLVKDKEECEHLESSRWGILEPPALEERKFKQKAGEQKDVEEKKRKNQRHSTLLIMPGAAFDRARNRIGYAGGFYDRYLERFPECETIALAFSLQVIEGIPAEAHDKKTGCIITEKEIV